MSIRLALFPLLFAITELRTTHRGKQPLVDLRLFANGPFRSSNVANALVSFGFFGGLTLLPIYLQTLRGLTALRAHRLCGWSADASPGLFRRGGRDCRRTSG
jgi:hypothetical protein